MTNGVDSGVTADTGMSADTGVSPNPDSFHDFALPPP